MARGMIGAAMHDLNPPARMSAYISSVEAESGSRTPCCSVAVILFFYPLRHTAKTISARERETRTRSSFPV